MALGDWLCIIAATAAIAASIHTATSPGLVVAEASPTAPGSCSTECHLGVFNSHCTLDCNGTFFHNPISTDCPDDPDATGCAASTGAQCQFAKAGAVIAIVATFAALLLIVAAAVLPAPSARLHCGAALGAALAAGFSVAVGGMAVYQHSVSADDNSCGMFEGAAGAATRFGDGFWAVAAVAALESALCVVFALRPPAAPAADEAAPLLRTGAAPGRGLRGGGGV